MADDRIQLELGARPDEKEFKAAGEKAVSIFEGAFKKSSGVNRVFDKSFQQAEKALYPTSGGSLIEVAAKKLMAANPSKTVAPILKNKAGRAASLLGKTSLPGLSDVLLRGTNTAANNRTTLSQRAKVKELEPTERMRVAAARRLNVGTWSDAQREETKAAREAIKVYNQELEVLKKLEAFKTEDKGGLFTNKFKSGVRKKLGRFSDYNSIFNKKTVKENGLLPTIGYKALRGAEILTKKLPVSLKKTLPLVSQFFRKFKARLLTNAIKAIIRLAKEGLSNLDQYSQHLGTPFHQNVLRLASSLLFLKNAFAAMVGPIVNAVTPALERLMDTFANLANHVGAFFAAITGQNQFSAALKKTVTTTKQAAGKLKDILAFDELNRLSGDTGGGVSADEMFEEWGKGTIFETMAEAVKNAKWKELGALLAGKINGLVKVLDEKEFGKKLGEKLGGAISTLSSFFNNLDTVAVGSAIAGWFNRVIGGITWSDLGNLIARKFTIVIDLFAGFIKTLDWTSVANALSDMIVGVFKGFKDWLDKVDWAQAGRDLVKTIADFIKGIKLEDIISAVLELLGSIGKAIGGFIDGLIEEIFGGVPKWLHNLLTGESTTIDLNANVKESVEAKFDSESKGLFAKILDFLGIGGGKNNTGADSEGGGMGPLGFTAGYAVMEKIKEWLGKIFSKEESITTYVGTMKGWGKWLPSGARARLEGLTKGGLPGVAGGVSVSGGSYLQFAAGGGVIDKGQLFIANEAGPELVGTVGGKTTVTNQDQFTQGLIDANEMVVDAVMQVVRAVNNKNFDVYMDAQKVGKSVTTYQNNAARRYGV